MRERSRTVPSDGTDAARPQPQRPERPPVHQATAAVVAATRPGRFQAAAERIWTTAVLFGVIGLLTGWLTHDVATVELIGQVSAEGTEADHRAAAALLHTIALVSIALGLVLETVLVAFLRRRRVFLRLLLSLTGGLAAVTLPLVLGIALVPGWRGVIIAVAFTAHGLLAIAGSVLMWLPAGRPRAT